MTVLRRQRVSVPPRRPMARLVGSTRPVPPAGPERASGAPASGAAATAGSRLAALAAGTPLAGIVTRLDAWRVRRPVVFWAVAAALAVGAGIALSAGAARLPGATPGGQAARSALDAFAAPSAAAATGTADAGPASSLLGGSIDPLDLVVKGGLVIILLFVTLRVLRRVQGGSAPLDARIRVIETRTLGAKTQLHLVAIGERHVLIGATPGRLVTLAELSAEELDTVPQASTARAGLAVDATADPAGAIGVSPGESAPGATFAAALDLARAGRSR